MRIVTQDEIVSELESGLKQQPRNVIVEYVSPQVNYGFDEKPNFQYCENNNIKCVNIGRRGGAFVVNKGDVGFGNVSKGLDNSVGEHIYETFATYLRNKGFNVSQNSNDILIDGYKVFGWASHYYKDFDATYITAHFTMSVDLELIRDICTKPMNKVPKGLNDFGIGKDEIIEFLNKII